MPTQLGHRGGWSSFWGAPPWAAWLVTRLLALALGAGAYAMVRTNVFFDTNYYARWAHGALTGRRVPYRDFGWEYPPGALPAVVGPGLAERLLPWAHVGRRIDVWYGVIWVGGMLLVDAAVMRFLRRRDAAPGGSPAIALWVYGPPLLGATSWARYDLLPAAAALIALVAAGVGRPARAGVLAGVGGTFKLWPALLAPIQRTRRAAVVAVAAVGLVAITTVAGTELVTGRTGFGQVFSYQSRRGLQVESLAALPLMWLHYLQVPGYSTDYRFGAWEIAGPSAGLLAHVSVGVYVVGLVLLGLAHWRFMREDAGGRLVALTAMAVMVLTIATDKVFSPQYLLWLLAVLAGACLLDPESWRPFVPWTLGVTGLTGLVFPWLYVDLLHDTWPGLVVLTFRDLLFVALTIAVGRRVLLELRSLRQPGSARQSRAMPSIPAWRFAGIGVAGVLAGIGSVALTASVQSYGARQLLGQWWVQTAQLAPWVREPRVFVHGGALVLMAVLGLVTVWLLGAWLVMRDHLSSRTVAAVAVLWAVPFAVAPPMLSQDAYAFLAQGATATAGSPYRAPATVLPHASPLLHAVDPLYRSRVSPYGPLALRLFSGCLWLAHGHPVIAVIVLRVVMLLAVAGAAWGAWLLAAPGRRALTIWLIAANPLVLLHLVGGLHLEAVLGALLVLAWVLHARGKPRRAVIAVVTAAAVKATALIVLPVLFIHAFRTGGKRALAELLAVAVAAAATLAALLQPDPLGWWTALPATLRVWNPVSVPTQAALVWATVTGQSVLGALPVMRAVSLAVGALAAAGLCWTSARRSTVSTAGYLLTIAIVAGPALWPWYVVPAIGCLIVAGGRSELVLAATLTAAASLSDLPMPMVQMQRVSAIGEAAAVLVAVVVLVVLRQPKPAVSYLVTKDVAALRSS